MAQYLWRAVGLAKPTVQSFLSISRASYSSHTVNEGPSDLLKKKIGFDTWNEYRRMKRLTDPEWTLRHRASVRKAVTKYTASLTDEQLQELRRKDAVRRRTWRAEDPGVRLREWLSNLVRRYAFVRDRLPWKIYTPVLYQDKVQHTCSTCLAQKFPGAYKLWWASHDGKHYQCNTCYLHGSNIMPEGYEDVSSMTELRKRMDELGH